jgi:hypothetical protein
MKKLLAFLLCMLLVVSMLPVASFASSNDDDDDDDSYYESDGIEASDTNVSVGRLGKTGWKYQQLRDFAAELGSTLNGILFSCEITDTDSGDKEIMFSLGDEYEEDEITILYMLKNGTIYVIAAMCDETGDIEVDASAGAAYMILDGPEYAAEYDSKLEAKKPGTYVTSQKSGEASTSSSPVTVKPSTGTTAPTETTGNQQEENPNTGIGALPLFFLRLF